MTQTTTSSQPLSPMEGALLQSLIASSDAQAKQLAELEPRLAQLTEQLREARASLSQVTRERDQLQQALAECQQSLAGDVLVQIPTIGSKEWIRPSGYKRYRITDPIEDVFQKQNPDGGLIPKLQPGTKNQMQKWNSATGQYEDLWETAPTGRGKIQTLYLDGEEIGTFLLAEMASVEAALHRALNPHPAK